MKNGLPVSTSWRDDSTESGVTRVEVAHGGLVFVPYKASEATLSVNQSIYGKNYSQDLAGGRGLKVVLPASATLANPTEMSFWINGNVFGLWYEIVTGTGVPGVMIDGIAYTVPAYPKADPFTRNGTSLHPALSGTIIAKDLGDGPHYVELMFPNHISEARSWMYYGYIVDAREGYQPVPPAGFLNVTQKSIASGGSYTDLTSDTHTSAQSAGRGIRKITFLNTTGTAATVTLSTANGASGNFWSQSVPANSSVDWDPGLVVVNPSYLYATQGTASAIVASIVESF